MTEVALVPFAPSALEGLTPDQQVDVLGTAWRGWRRAELVNLWAFGCLLRDVLTPFPRSQRQAVRDRIDINRETARRYIRLADGFKSDAQLVHLGLRSVDAAIQHLDAKQKRIGAGSTTRTTVAVEEAEVETARSTVPSCEPVEVEVETARTTVPCAAVEPEVVEPDFQDFSKAVDEVAAEAGVALSLSPEELERLHIRIQDEDGSVVQILNRKVDRADQRHREDVAAINAERRATAAERRKNRDVCDAHLVAPLCECGSGAVHDADLLARFYAVQRKAPAA